MEKKWEGVGQKKNLIVVRKDRVCLFFANSAVVCFFQEKINTYWNVEPSDD
jgi:hypothetical protein